MIETYAYARAGILGNPSDGYFGRTIAMSARNFRARVLLSPSARLEIRPSKADMPVFESLDDLYATTRWRGYYGGIRILQALLVRFMDYCRKHDIELPNRNFTIEYESTIPLRLGMGGSSSIIIAALRAICQYFEIDIPLAEQTVLALETETKELGVPAGPQDRVIQIYEGLVYMDFREDLMTTRGYGEYERLDPALLPNMYLAYRTSLSEGTEVFHNNVRERWNRGDAQVVGAMHRWAEIAAEGREALVGKDYSKLNRLINENFDLRLKIYDVGRGNIEMIEAARSVGVSANFAGSGGAIAGVFDDDEMFARLVEVMKPLGIAVLKPQVVPAVHPQKVERR